MRARDGASCRARPDGRRSVRTEISWYLNAEDESSLRQTIAVRIFAEAGRGVVDPQELRRTALLLAKISQETLAEMVGTTRSRVSYFMNRFRKLCFVDYNGDLKVHSSLLNVVLYDKPQLQREQN